MQELPHAVPLPWAVHIWHLVLWPIAEELGHLGAGLKWVEPFWGRGLKGWGLKGAWPEGGGGGGEVVGAVEPRMGE